MKEEQCHQVTYPNCSLVNEEKCRTVYDVKFVEECETKDVEVCEDQMAKDCETLQQTVCTTEYVHHCIMYIDNIALSHVCCQDRAGHQGTMPVCDGARVSASGEGEM